MAAVTRRPDSLWYKDAIIYEVHIRSFFDSNGDGIGDFKGLIGKLDYIADLGVTAVWVLPFYPSPLKDDGYDISDYFNVHPDYGTLRDFRDFLREAHRRGIRVITELVLNHTSDQHSWFQRSRRARPGSVWRNFYVWSGTTEKFKDARIIFKDFEKSNWEWDQLAGAYYWHRFYSHQPDLNYDEPQVRRAMFRVIDYWFGMGVDGLRLDAVPYLFEREGTNCENLPETYQFLKELRRYVDARYGDRMLLAEANQWPENAALYFGAGDECHMAFHFPLMPRMFMSVQMEDRFPIIDIMEQTPQIPPNCQWGLFLRNHDELTLEMVTDEERDYMYRVYAKDPRAKLNLGIRRRLAPLMDNNRRKIELMNILLFSMPGTPVIYYGDEIGMGDNFYLGDRNGVRTPMQWGPDRNGGFSRANPQMLYLPLIIDPEYHYEALNVENQGKNLSSLLWWMKRSIALRKRYRAFGRGTLEFLSPSNPRILAFFREYGDERILVVANLSRFSQACGLELSRFAGYTPEDVFSQNRFPVIREQPYVLTLGPYWYHMFLLHREVRAEASAGEPAFPEFTLGSWDELFSNTVILENYILPIYLMRCRWFGGKARIIRFLQIIEDVDLNENSSFLLIEVNYTEGASEVYQLHLSFACDEKAARIAEQFPQAVMAKLRKDGKEGILYDGVYDPEVRGLILSMMERRRTLKGRHGVLTAYHGTAFKKILAAAKASRPDLSSSVFKAEQSNTSLKYENSFFLKIPRRLEAGMNPDLEIVRFLTEKAKFPHVPPFAGAVEYRRAGSEPFIVDILSGFVPSQGVLWEYTLEEIKRYFERVLSGKEEAGKPPGPPAVTEAMDYSALPPLMQELIGAFYLQLMELLGARSAGMHAALAGASDDPRFAPETFSLLYLRAVYQGLRSQVRRSMQILARNAPELPEKTRPLAAEVLALEPEILKVQQKIFQKKIQTARMRVHGDYHLGQVLYTGKDLIIIDFEGEPARPLGERRLKRSPLRDVAGMLQSFHYASYVALEQYAAVRPEDASVLEPWAALWSRYAGAVFLHSYIKNAQGLPFMPPGKADFDTLLMAFLLGKAVYELAYEFGSRPDWVPVALQGIKNILRLPPKDAIAAPEKTR